jgi:hypothetical protein
MNADGKTFYHRGHGGARRRKVAGIGKAKVVLPQIDADER